MKRFFLLLFFIGELYFLQAQKVTSCDQIDTFFTTSSERVRRLNTSDPELIPLHYYFMLDIWADLQFFASDFIPKLGNCEEVDYYATVTRYDEIAYGAKLKMDTLAFLSARIDSVFYAKALTELHFENRENAYYLVDRALQYKRNNPDAILLKCQLLFEDGEYDECIKLLQILYHDSVLERSHEDKLSDFSMLYYTTVYQLADSLIKQELASDALALFQTLEKFCQNMPANYCNDDYYHGLLRSKEGIYESYLLIAKVARERGNREIEEKFIEYAEEYRRENRKFMDKDSEDSLQTTGTTFPNVALSGNNTHSFSGSGLSREEVLQQELAYTKLFVDALDAYMEGRKDEAYQKLTEALRLEECNCFPPDERLHTLHKAISSGR